ncbi:AAA family ATPase [Pseudescherichia sp.]|uniref:AAA family ATPase n=1 Tax=Pseudescherichia sp. TaxID=2055881 RepID=UPI00289BE703|nr:AAA family ATPase [Pseudescherichia sp.]
MDSLLTTRIVTWIRAGHAGFYLHSGEDDRIDTLLSTVAKETDFRLREWNLAWGWVDFTDRYPLVASSLEMPPQADRMLAGLLDDDLENTILVFRNIRTVLDSSPMVAARLQQLLLRIRRHHSGECCVICVDDRVDIPSLIEPLITLVELPLPRREAIRQQAEQFALERELIVSDALLNRISITLTGLTASQINQSLSVALEKYGELDEKALATLLQEKEQIIGKSGVLEMVKVRENLTDIGGLENLKKWLERKAAILQRLPEAEEAGLQAPKGVLVAGMPGCGKSLTAKAVANLFGLPLLRLDIGSLLGKYVGESEHNMRRALAMAEAISPCVLWVDELEKAFVGIGSSNASEVTSRLLGYFLTWMQEKTSAVFVVATANNVTALPPELLRKGRFDDVFYVGFPYLAERKAILSIHLKAAWQAFSAEQKQQLAVLCRNFAGADIQNAVNDARESAFLAGVNIDYSRLCRALERTVPLRDTLRDQVGKYEAQFEKMKLKAASHIDGISLAQMITLADDTNPHERLRVAEAEECSEDLLEKLAQDSYPAIRHAVYSNPYCTARILSACIAPAETGDVKDETSLALACVHHNAPTNLLLSLIQKNKLNDEILLQLAEKAHCVDSVLDALLSRKNSALQQAVLRHANCPEAQREEFLYEQNDALRAAVALNPALTAAQQEVLLNDKKSVVRIALANNPALTEEVKHQLAQDHDTAVVDALEEAQKQPDEPAQESSGGNDDSALLVQIDKGDVHALLALAERRHLSALVQRRFAQKVTNEAALATLAVNPILTAETQQILASEGNPAVRDALAINSALVPAVQVYLYENGLKATQQRLVQNAALCEEVQLMAVQHKNTDVLAFMAQNPAVGEIICDMLLAINRVKIDEALASNPNISQNAQRTLYSRSYYGTSGDREERVKYKLCRNENLSEELFNELSVATKYHDDLLCNPSIGKFNYGRIEKAFSLPFWKMRPSFLEPEYFTNSGLSERLQSVLIENNKDNACYLALLAANTGLVPSQQIILSQNTDLDVLLNLIRNPASTSRTVETATQQIKSYDSIKDKLSERVKEKAEEFENKKAKLAKQHELTSDGFIKNITTVDDIIENELLSSIKDELVWLRDFTKKVGGDVTASSGLFTSLA